MWETHERREKMELWSKEKMGSARTRGRQSWRWWGPKRWGRMMCGVGERDSGATQRRGKRMRGQSQSQWEGERVKWRKLSRGCVEENLGQ